MRESISYAFLLNIIILFVFVCGAIVTGIFSYYRAFRAATAIVSEIEKYEGYNCVSVEAISKKLSNIGYVLPFDLKCGSNEENCIVAVDGSYKIISYNYNDNADNLDTVTKYSEKIDYSTVGTKNFYYPGSDYYCGQENGSQKCYSTSRYSYGVYTYMYTDLPVLSGFLRFPVYLKTKIMTEQRYLTKATKDGEDVVFNFDIIPKQYLLVEADAATAFRNFAEKTNAYYTERVVSGQKYAGYLLERYGYGVRTDNNVYDPTELLSIASVYKYDLRDLFRWANSSNSSGNYSDISIHNPTSLLADYKNSCGYQVDWSLY